MIHVRIELIARVMYFILPISGFRVDLDQGNRAAARVPGCRICAFVCLGLKLLELQCF
jgi:hypothetical protein